MFCKQHPTSRSAAEERDNASKSESTSKKKLDVLFLSRGFLSFYRKREREYDDDDDDDDAIHSPREELERRALLIFRTTTTTTTTTTWSF